MDLHSKYLDLAYSIHCLASNSATVNFPAEEGTDQGSKLGGTKKGCSPLLVWKCGVLGFRGCSRRHGFLSDTPHVMMGF
jgi:hypothetical protein